MQVGVTTNVKGLIRIEDCKGDGREVTQGRGCAVQNVGRMRRLAKSKTVDDTNVSTENSGVLTPNRPVEQSARHRLKWVAPLQTSYLLGRRDARGQTSEPITHSHPPAHSHTRANCPAGLWARTPLLNLLTDQILTIHADLALANKLVPQGVLDLIPSKTELIIVKKFPGNADKTQEEMMHLVRVCSFSQYLSVKNLHSL